MVSVGVVNYKACTKFPTGADRKHTLRAKVNVNVIFNVLTNADF